MVQSNINKFGEMAVAGCGSYSKVEGFGFLPITCFALALTTFISQNLGAKEYGRGKKGGCLRRLLFHYHCRADRPGDLWPCTCTDRRIQQYAGGNLLWNSSGSCSYFILFSPGFPPTVWRGSSGERENPQYLCWSCWYAGVLSVLPTSPLPFILSRTSG